MTEDANADVSLSMSTPYIHIEQAESTPAPTGKVLGSFEPGALKDPHYVSEDEVEVVELDDLDVWHPLLVGTWRSDEGAHKDTAALAVAAHIILRGTPRQLRALAQEMDIQAARAEHEMLERRVQEGRHATLEEARQRAYEIQQQQMGEQGR